MHTAITVSKEVLKLGDPKRAKVSRRFFKTGPGQYGEGDIFIGITVPQLRRLAKHYQGLSLAEISLLLHSPVHEVRFLALVMLIDIFKEGNEKQRTRIFSLYCKNIQRSMNNWDLIDISAPIIVGSYLERLPKDLLYSLAKSKSVWERRVAMLATFFYIRKNSCTEALRIAEILINDEHDLIQKAVGWMLREVGKNCSQAVEKKFLDKHAATMPRTTLRYAIEKFSPQDRKYYLSRK